MELAAVVGFWKTTYIQLDEVPLAMFCEESVREKAKAKADGDDPDKVVGQYVDLLCGGPPFQRNRCRCRGRLCEASPVRPTLRFASARRDLEFLGAPDHPV